MGMRSLCDFEFVCDSRNCKNSADMEKVTLGEALDLLRNGQWTTTITGEFYCPSCSQKRKEAAHAN